MKRYNSKLVHSRTGEIPLYRFNRLKKEGKDLFRPFTVPEPYESPKDIFSLRDTRRTDGYRRISFNGKVIQLKNIGTYEQVEIRIIPGEKTQKTELRFWNNRIFIGREYIPSG